jgi:hypothetical protein
LRGRALQRLLGRQREEVAEARDGRALARRMTARRAQQGDERYGSLARLAIDALI